MAGMAFAFSPEMVKQTMGDGDENRKFGERDARLVLLVSQSRRSCSRILTPPRSNATLQSCISLLIVDDNAIATEEERHCILCDASNVRCH